MMFRFINYLNNNEDLIFQTELGMFRLRYYFDGKYQQTLIHCDSLFKLRFYIYNTQKNLIDDYKKICIFKNWSF